MKDLDVFEQYYTKEEVAKFLGISIGTLLNRLSSGKDHPPVIPRINKFRKDAFDKWLRDREKKAIA